jgi:hypothetical protein
MDRGHVPPEIVTKMCELAHVASPHRSNMETDLTNLLSEIRELYAWHERRPLLREASRSLRKKMETVRCATAQLQKALEISGQR